MKSICLIFNIHQPVRLKRFRFFDIGASHYYYDDYFNETQMQRLAGTSVMPANAMLLKQIIRFKEEVKASFCISGVTLEQMLLYSPELYGSFRYLAETGCVEFLGGTYSNSLSSLINKEAFFDQANQHRDVIHKLSGQTPEVFFNSEMIYSDDIGGWIAEMGYKATLAEGARHIMGWRSPNFVYFNAVNPRLKVLLRHFRLSDDLTFHFSNQAWSEYPLTAEKFLKWILDKENEEVVNICIDYGTFGIFQPMQTGIFAFMERFIQLVAESDEVCFSTPSRVVRDLQPVSIINVPQPVTWSEEERDLMLWTGNDLQNEALSKLYEIYPYVAKSADPVILRDWNYLQSSDHFLNMVTDQSARTLHIRPNPFNSPWDAFINFMNIVNDFRLRLKMP